MLDDINSTKHFIGTTHKFFILFRNLYYLFETYISMKLIMMDDLDMRVHKKVYIFLKDQYK